MANPIQQGLKHLAPPDDPATVTPAMANPIQQGLKLDDAPFSVVIPTARNG